MFGSLTVPITMSSPHMRGWSGLQVRVLVGGQVVPAQAGCFQGEQGLDRGLNVVPAYAGCT